MNRPYLSYNREKRTGLTDLFVRLAEKRTALLRQRPIPKNRELRDRLAEVRIVPPETVLQHITCAGVPCQWITSPRSADTTGVILYIHGGSWIYGSLRTARAFGILLEEYTGCKVLVVDYRLLPEHPYPAGLDDCFSVYQWLLASGYQPGHIGLFGDSAGGNLSLCLLNRLKSLGYPYPACAGIASPVTDLRPDSPFATSDADLLYVPYPPGQEQTILDLYAHNQSKSHPFLSPICGDLSGLPPILIHCGSDEPLVEDNIAYGGAAYAQGVDIQVVVYEGLFHDFTVTGRALHESLHSIAAFAAFFEGWMAAD